MTIKSQFLSVFIFFLFCCAPVVAWMIYRVLKWSLTVFGGTPSFHRHRFQTWKSVERLVVLKSPFYGRTEHTEWRQSQTCGVEGCGYAREIRMEMNPR